MLLKREVGSSWLPADEDGLLPLAALLDVPGQMIQALVAHGAEDVEVADEGGQGDDHPDAPRHLQEGPAREDGTGVGWMRHEG
jgi:hypothetical protein